MSPARGTSDHGETVRRLCVEWTALYPPRPAGLYPSDSAVAYYEQMDRIRELIPTFAVLAAGSQ